MANRVLTVTLNPAVDKIVHVKNFSIGKDFRAQNIYFSAGGKGINVSRTLKSLGIKSVATGFLGGVSGAFIERELKKENLVSSFLKVKRETRTNLTVIGRKGAITRVLEGGPAVDPAELKGFKRKFLSLLRGCPYVFFSGSILPNLSPSIYRQLIVLAHQCGVKAFLDTSKTPLLFGLRARPFLIKPNLEEAEEILGQKLNSLSKIKKAVQYFHKRGVRIVIVSLGRKGAVGSDGRQFFLVQAPQIRCRNNVGCGDALLAGFAAGYIRKYNFRECMRLAVAAGSANALSLQPGKIKKNHIQKILAKIKVKEIS